MGAKMFLGVYILPTRSHPRHRARLALPAMYPFSSPYLRQISIPWDVLELGITDVHGWIYFPKFYKDKVKPLIEQETKSLYESRGVSGN